MTEADPAAAVEAVAERYWETFLERSPVFATIHGDDRYDDRLDDPGPAGRAAARRLAEETETALQPILTELVSRTKHVEILFRAHEPSQAAPPLTLRARRRGLDRTPAVAHAVANATTRISRLPRPSLEVAGDPCNRSNDETTTIGSSGSVPA